MANNYINVDLVGLQGTLTEIEVGVDDVVNRLAYAFYDDNLEEDGFLTDSEVSGIPFNAVINRLNKDFYGGTQNSGIYKRRKERGDWGTPLNDPTNFQQIKQIKAVGNDPHIILGVEYLPSAEYYGTGNFKRYNTNLYPGVAHKPDEIIKLTNKKNDNNWYNNARQEIIYSATGYYKGVNRIFEAFCNTIKKDGDNVNYLLSPLDIEADENDTKPIEQTPDYLSYNSPILRKRKWARYQKPQKTYRYGKPVTERGFYYFTK